MTQSPWDKTNPGRRPSGSGPAEHKLDGHLVRDRAEEGPAALALSDWPFQSYLELGALPSAVPCARLHTKQVLWEWRLQTLIDAVELIVSELVTNGLRASEGLTGSRYAGHWAPGAPPLRLWLHAHQQRIAIQVWDGNDRLPVQQVADLDAESGRGLLLVETLSETWGSYKLQGSSGKVIWAVHRDHHDETSS